jgi:hypothetical protein
MNAEASPRRLRWFQLGLRDILALTVICAILLAWWNDRRATAKSLLAAEDTATRQADEHRAEVDRLLDKLVILEDHIATNEDQYLRRTRGLTDYVLWAALERQGSSSPPSMVSGLVVRIPENGLVEINLGSDDGLKQGQTLDVMRLGTTIENTQHLGRIQLTSVHKTTSIGRTLPGARGKIEENDHVATRLDP